MHIHDHLISHKGFMSVVLSVIVDFPRLVVKLSVKFFREHRVRVCDTFNKPFLAWLHRLHTFLFFKMFNQIWFLFRSLKFLNFVEKQNLIVVFICT
jgi:hypothetical protein